MRRRQNRQLREHAPRALKLATKVTAGQRIRRMPEHAGGDAPKIYNELMLYFSARRNTGEIRAKKDEFSL